MNKRKDRTTKKNGAPRDTLMEKILNAGIVLAVFILVMVSCVFVSEYRDADRSYFTQELVISRLRDGNYGWIAEAFYGSWEEDSAEDGKENIRALAKYIDAAFMHRAFEECGMEEKAAAQEQKMKENASRLGIFEGEMADIDRAVAQ